MSAIRLLLVSDNVDLVDGLRAWLVKEQDIDVIGVEGSGVDVLSRIVTAEPQIVLLDDALGPLNGFATCRGIRAQLGCPTVLMTFHDSETVRSEARAAGADGVIGKDRVAEALVPLIRRLAVGSPDAPT